jgi:hypothetical protein
MMSLRRIFGLMLLFFFFEAVVAIVTTLAYPDTNVFLACVAMRDWHWEYGLCLRS